MRLGLAVFSAAVVFGGYTLVNTVSSRPATPGAAPAAEERGWLPGAIDDEPAAETRTFELIRYLNPDGSFGMVDDPRRVPPGAKILGRERKTVAVAKPAPAEDVPAEQLGSRLPLRDGAGRPLSAAEQRVMERLLETGVFPDAKQLEEMQGDLDELERERAGR